MKNEELEDMLTELDPPYETRDELRIGRMLDQYGIPFFYRQPTIIYNEGKNDIWKPSFTMYSYGGAVIDYIAEADKEQIPQRQKLYRYNQIPAIFLGPKDLHEPNWDEQLYEKLQQEYRKAFDPKRYMLALCEE
ncbi:MAG: hypothetical protein JXN61_05015 [Sedimentisphaerales bacterium]|nr:hypothetical protein [Sedimentisphaerales bacterium]